MPSFFDSPHLDWVLSAPIQKAFMMNGCDLWVSGAGFILWSRVRLLRVLLVATLMVVAGCSMLALKTNAQGYQLLLRGRHQDGVCSNVGTILVEGKPYPLPATLPITGPAQWSIDYNPPAGTPGCDFVRWETEGSLIVRNPQNKVNVLLVDGPGTLYVVYRGTCCSVGGVITPTNPLIALAPYLAMIGLVATLPIAYAVKKRSN